MTKLLKYGEKFFVYFFAGISVIIVVLGIGRIKDNTPTASAEETGGSNTGAKTGGLFAVRGETITAEGAPFATPWGNAVAAVTFTDGKLTGVTMPKVPNSPPSVEARQYLVDQALRAGNANIQGVTGATYVSDAFKSSLESAIAKARAQSTVVATAQSQIATVAGATTDASQPKPSVSRGHDDDEDDDEDDHYEKKRHSREYDDDEDDDEDWDD